MSTNVCAETAHALDRARSRAQIMSSLDALYGKSSDGPELNAKLSSNDTAKRDRTHERMDRVLDIISIDSFPNDKIRTVLRENLQGKSLVLENTKIRSETSKSKVKW